MSEGSPTVGNAPERLLALRKQVDSWRAELAAEQVREEEAKARLEEAEAKLQELGITSEQDIVDLVGEMTSLIDECEGIISGVKEKREAIARGEIPEDDDTSNPSGLL